MRPKEQLKHEPQPENCLWNREINWGNFHSPRPNSSFVISFSISVYPFPSWYSNSGSTILSSTIVSKLDSTFQLPSPFVGDTISQKLHSIDEMFALLRTVVKLNEYCHDPKIYPFYFYPYHNSQCNSFNFIISFSHELLILSFNSIFCFNSNHTM